MTNRHENRNPLDLSGARTDPLRDAGYTTPPAAAAGSRYSVAKVAELREEAEERGLVVPDGARKADLIQLLESDDEVNGV